MPGLAGHPVPAEKQNPRVVHVDLVSGSERDLRRGLEQLTHALVGRLTASERLAGSLQEELKGRGRYTRTQHTRAQPQGHATPAHHAAWGTPAHGQTPHRGMPVGGGVQVGDFATYQRPRGAWGVAAAGGDHVSAPRTGSPQRHPQHGRRTRVAKLLIINTVRGGGEALAQALVQVQQHIRNAAHEPVVHWVTPETLSARHVAAELLWVVSDLGYNGRGVAVYVGASSSAGLDLSQGETVPRQVITDAFTSLPPQASFVFLLDSGFGSTPFELPFSVVARRTPGGFEMSTGQEHSDYGPVLLVTTYADRAAAPHGYDPTAACGAYLAGLMHLLATAPAPTFRALASGLRDDLQMRFGNASPLPLFSSNRPFHPEALLDIA